MQTGHAWTNDVSGMHLNENYDQSFFEPLRSTAQRDLLYDFGTMIGKFKNLVEKCS